LPRKQVGVQAGYVSLAERVELNLSEYRDDVDMDLLAVRGVGAVGLDALTKPKAFWVEPKSNKVLDNHIFCERSYSTQEELRHLKEEMVFYWT
jgi:hypothetical protein